MYIPSQPQLERLKFQRTVRGTRERWVLPEIKVPIRSGDDIKTVQSNLGHSDATTALNIYAHVTEQMNRASADRMQGFIQNTVKTP